MSVFELISISVVTVLSSLMLLDYIVRGVGDHSLVKPVEPQILPYPDEELQ